MTSNRTQYEVTVSNHHQQQQERTSTTIDGSIQLLEELRLKPGESIEPVGPTLLQKVMILSILHEI